MYKHIERGLQYNLVTKNTLLCSHKRYPTKYNLIEKAKRVKVKHAPEFHNGYECDMGLCSSMQNNF